MKFRLPGQLDPASRHSIAETIMDTLDPGNEGGVVENAVIRGRDVAAMLARLIEMLHEKDVLSDDDVCRFVSGAWIPVTEDENFAPETND